MKILITGGRGQLGRAFDTLSKMPEYRSTQFISYDIEEMDILNQTKVLQAFNEIKPDAVVHAAAYTQVDKAESDTDGAYRINVIGTQNIAAACLRHNSKMVYVSTDYVFDGKKESPYIEFDVTAPVNVYGKTKLEGEKIAARICPRLFITRTAWLYGDGQNFVKTMLRLAKEREYLSVVSDQIGTPTYTIDLAQEILRILDTESYGTYHMTNNGYCSWFDFAQEIFRIANIPIEVRPTTTEQYPTPAVRPQHSVLSNYMLKLTVGDYFRSWDKALGAYMKTII